VVFPAPESLILLSEQHLALNQTAPGQDNCIKSHDYDTFCPLVFGKAPRFTARSHRLLGFSFLEIGARLSSNRHSWWGIAGGVYLLVHQRGRRRSNGSHA
jgi:hypothetical protein